MWSVGPSGKALLAAGFNHPEGLALTADGRKPLVVEEGIDQVTSLDLTNGDRHSRVPERRPGAGMRPMNGFGGLLVG